MSGIRFSKDHEWVKVDGDIATVGISPYAQDQLGDVVFVDLPEVGKRFAKGEVAGVVESVKAAADVYAPIGGTVTDQGSSSGGHSISCEKDNGLNVGCDFASNAPAYCTGTGPRPQ